MLGFHSISEAPISALINQAILAQAPPQQLGGKPEKYGARRKRREEEEDRPLGTKYDGLERIEEIKARYEDIFDIATKEQTQEIVEVIAPFISKQEPISFARLPVVKDIDFVGLERNSLALLRLEMLLQSIAAVRAMNRADDALLMAIAAAV